MSCGVGCRHSLDLVSLWLWCRLAAAAPIRPFAWERLYAEAAALKNNNKKKFLYFFTCQSLREGSGIQEFPKLIQTSIPLCEEISRTVFHGANFGKHGSVDYRVCYHRLCLSHLSLSPFCFQNNVHTWQVCSVGLTEPSERERGINGYRVRSIQILGSQTNCVLYWSNPIR